MSKSGEREVFLVYRVRYQEGVYPQRTLLAVVDDQEKVQQLQIGLAVKYMRDAQEEGESFTTDLYKEKVKRWLDSGKNLRSVHKRVLNHMNGTFVQAERQLVREDFELGEVIDKTELKLTKG